MASMFYIFYQIFHNILEVIFNYHKSLSPLCYKWRLYTSAAQNLYHTAIDLFMMRILNCAAMF